MQGASLLEDRRVRLALNMENKRANGFAEILNCRKKTELARLCKSTTLYSSDFAESILNAGDHRFPYRHNCHAQEFVPDEMKLTEDDMTAMAAAKPGQMGRAVASGFGKIDRTFRCRRQLVGHMFYTADHSIWHFFYFDQRDTSKKRNHWKEGSHIHIINFLWPHRTAEEIWREFKSRNVQMKGSLHIKYVSHDMRVLKHPNS